MRTMAAGEFKAKCLAVMDEVKATGETVFITKRGKVVARLIGPEEPAVQKVDVESIFGSMRGLITVTGGEVDPGETLIPIGKWDHLKEDWSEFPPE